MHRRIGVTLAIGLLLVVSAGCLRGPLSWQRMTLNQAIAESDVSFIMDGTTRLTDVVNRLGSPDELTLVGESVVARYHFSDGKYFRADYGWGLRFLVPYMAPELALGGGGFGTDIFQLICDQQWIVREHSFAWHANSSEFRFLPFSDPAK